MLAASLGASGAFPLLNVSVLLATLSVSCWFLCMSVLMSARMVETFTDCVSDGERKKTTTRTMASVTRSNNKLILIRSEEHTSELQSRQYLVCRLLLEKKKI